jgi:hypothetical protein
LDRAAIRQIYHEANAFFGRPELKEAAAKRGWAILYGPLIEQPPILFIGLQPGGKTGDKPWSGEGDPWPKTNQYVEDQGRFANNVRQIFQGLS